MFKKYFSWLFGKSCCATPQETSVQESLPEAEVPEVVQEPVAEEAPVAPRKPKKKYYKKKKPSNT